MSNTIDSKVVEIRFDNSQFETNVRTSMSTLDKLKASLHLDGATKGLENINDSVKKVNFNPIGEGIEAIKMKFSALDVMAVTALSNITNSVVNAGKNLISSFTIEPIKSGFSEFELKMGSVQTIMASTGESLDTINDYLAELNEYSDKTIYSFADMTSNIGKFTNAGVKLEDAVMAIKGISNEAAVSGANAQEASRAMYNFSQALSAGYVKLIDWKSIENANMATVEFKQTLLDTALAMGTVTKEGDSYITTTTDLNGKVSDAFNATKNFNDSLSAQWMTTDVLTTALAAYATDVREMTEEEKKAYEEKLRGIGYTEEQIKSLEELGMKAYDSAQDVKTFSMMMDTLKEAAQSGWAETWELIIGDFEQGKKLWTSLSNFFGDIIAKISDTRNAILKSALGKGFSELSDKINSFISPAKKAIDTVGKVKDTVNEVADSVTDLGDIVDKVIIGKFGNGQERINKLTEAGINYYQVQNKVNEKLGYAKRYTEEQIAAQDKLLGTQSKTIDGTEKEADVNAKLTKKQKLTIERLGILTEAQMREAGCTEDQIEAIQELTKTADKLGMPLDEFIDKMDEIDGRWLLLDSFKSIGKSLIEVFEAIGKAWTNVFPSTIEDKANTLFDIIAGFHKFSRDILDSATANADKLRRTFEGLFAALDIVRRVAGGALSFAFKLLQSVLSAMNLNILDVTANIGDAIKGFRDWIVEHDKITECINKLGEIIAKVITKISEWVNAFLEIPVVSNIINNFGTIVSNTFDDLETHFADCKQAVIDFIERTKKLDGITIDNIRIAFKDFYENVLKKFFNVDGKFETLETTFKELGTIFENFITEKFGKPVEKVTETLNGFKDSIVNFVKKIATNLNDKVGLGEILTMLLGGSLVFSMVKMGKFLESLVSPLEALTDVAKSVKNVLGKVGGAIKGFTLSVKAKAILTIAAAIAVLAGSVWLLAQLDAGKLWSAVGALAVLSLALVGVVTAFGAMGKIDGIKISKDTIAAILAIAASLGILVSALKGLDNLKSDNIGRNLAIMGGMLVSLAGVAILIGRFSKLEGGMGKGALALIGIVIAVKMLVGSLITIDKIPFNDLAEDIAALGILMISLGVLGFACKKMSAGAGIGLLAMVVAMKLLASSLSDIGNIKGDLVSASIFISGMLVIFGALVAISQLAGDNAAKAGIMILAMAGAISILAGVAKLLSTLDPEGLKGATIAIGIMMGLFAGIIALSDFAGENAAKVSVMLLALAGAIAILAGIMVVLSWLDPTSLIEPMIAIGHIIAMFALILAASRYAKNVKVGPLIAIAVSLGILTAALGAMSMIDKENLDNATLAIMGVMAMLALVMIASERVKAATGPLIAMTAAIGILGGVLIALSVLNPEGALPAAVALGVLLLTLSGAMFILSKITGELIKGASSLLIMSVGLIAIAGALLLLKDVSFKSIAGGLVALGLALLVLVGASGLMSLFAAGATALALVLISIGGALLLAGLGALGFAEAMAIIVPLLPAVGEGIAAIGVGIASFIVSLAQVKEYAGDFTIVMLAISASVILASVALIALSTALLIAGAGLLLGGVGALAFAGALAIVAPILPSIGDGLTAVGVGLSNFITSVASCKDQAGDFASVIYSVGESIAAALTIIAGGMTLAGLAAIVLGAGLVVAGAGLVVAAAGVTIAAAAIVLLGLAISAFVTSLANAAQTVYEIFSTLGPAGEQAGSMLVTGFANGIKNTLDSVVEAGKSLVSKIGNTICTLLGIHSPSRVAYEWGQNTGEGYANGLTDSTPEAESSAGGFIDKIKSFFSGDTSTTDTTTTKGSEAAEGFNTGLTDGLDPQSALSGLGEGNFDISSFSSLMNTDGNEAGNNFNLGLGDGLDISSVMNGEMGSFDMSQFSSLMNTDGSEAGNNFNLGLGDGLDISSVMNGEMGSMDMSSVNSTMSLNGSDAGKSFSDGFVSGIDTSGINATLDSIVSTIKSKTSEFKAAGNTIATTYSDAINKAVSTISGGSARIFTTLSAIMNQSNAVIHAGSLKIIQEVKLTVTKVLMLITNSALTFKALGMKLMTMFAMGIRTASSFVKNAMKLILAGALSSIAVFYFSFYNAGSHLVSGFAAGITANSFKAEATATAMAEKALDAAKDVLDINSPSKEFFKIGKFTAEGLANGIEKNTKLSKAAAGSLAQGIMDEYKKVSKSMNFGTGAMKAYIRQYGKMSTDMEYNNKVLKKASSLITEYGEKLYKETEQYEKDNKQLDEHKKKLDELQKEREEILKKDTSGKNADKVKKSLESIDKKIDETKQKIIDDEKTIQEHTADAFNKVRDNIKDSLSDSMDMLSTSLDSGIDLFKKFKEEAKAETWNVDPFSKFGGDSDLTKQQILDNMKSQSDGLSKWKLKLDLLASKGISDELLTYLKDLGPSGSKYIEEFMKMTGAELEKADNYYKNIIAKSTKEASTEDYLANMQSQVDGIREWRADIEKLANTNLADGLIEELKALGPEGADQIKYFLNLTAEEIEKANSLYNDKLSLSLETFLGNYADNQKAVKKWSNDMSKLVKKDFSPDIIKALGDAGMDKSKSLIEVLLNMTPEQVKKFNEDFAKSSSLSESAANSIMADYANAGKNSAKAFKEGFKTEVTDSSDEENSIVGSLTRMELGSVATDAIESGEKDVENSTTDMSEDSANAIETETVNEWELAGKCCVEGFAKGITENTFMAQARAIAMAKAALEAAEAELGVASPSKKFIRIGEYVSEGFAIGINNYANQPVDSITNLSDTILTNASNVVNGINNAMDGKINARPTISPVVDMDNVNTESLHFTSMLDAVLTEPVTSIGETVANLQAKIEESNSKMTNAINGLRDDMNNYYSGDDSEIALYVDSKKLASSLARPMNNQLNILSKRGAY